MTVRLGDAAAVDTLASGALRSLGVVLIIGRDSLSLIETLSRTLDRPCPPLPPRGPESGEAISWACGGDDPPVLNRVDKPKGALKRHTRKYAGGMLGEDRSFVFKGPDEAMNIRAHSVSILLQIGEGVDPATYLHRLRSGDFEAWLRTAVQDDELADEVAAIAAHAGLGVEEARLLVRGRAVGSCEAEPCPSGRTP